MTKFEIHTTVITKIESTTEQAHATAIKLSLKYGKATVKANGQRQSVYQYGMKIR